MKNARSLVMLGIAVLAGLAAVFLAARWIQDQSRVSGDRVAVAMLDIQLGARITPEMILMIDWPAATLPDGAQRDPTALAGRVARMSMSRGEPILESKLAPDGTKGGLSAVVTEGKRAITVRVNDVVGVAGYALPGNYVDIMVNTQAPNSTRSSGKDQLISKIVLERILVLAIGQQAGREETQPRVVNAVTLEVTPEQAESLDLARSVGSLSLVLRNQIDQDAVATEGATKETLLAGQASSSESSSSAPGTSTGVSKVAVPVRRSKPVVRRSVQPRAAASAQCVEVIRGTSKSVECF